ncbi:MAG: cupin domain-containing protein [Rhizobacter sp.]
MSTLRVFHSSNHFQPADGEPVRSVITGSPEAVVVAWYVQPGQTIAAHLHPQGQDTWTILSGRGQYQIDAEGRTESIREGDVVVAMKGQVHGVHNDADEPLVFISVVAPADAGYHPL